MVEFIFVRSNLNALGSKLYYYGVNFIIVGAWGFFFSVMGGGSGYCAWQLCAIVLLTLPGLEGLHPLWMVTKDFEPLHLPRSSEV